MIDMRPAIPVYRHRARLASDNVGHHGWDEKRGAWDTENDAEAYCLDAVATMPSGSCKGWVGRSVIASRALREA